MILVVNLNLAVDRLVHLERLMHGGVHRAPRAERMAGGKGVNVARVLKALQRPALLTGFLGGRAGEFIKQSLQSEGIRESSVPIQNESRTCIILDEEGTRTQTVINEEGPEISAEEQKAFLESYARLLSNADLVVITGSLPPGLPPDTYARLIHVAHKAGKRVLLDTSAEALRAALSARPFIVKINGAEASELLKLPLNDLNEAAAAVHKLIEMGACHAMITMGAMGAALNFEGVEFRVKPPHVEARNIVGSGDSVMAGLAAALARSLGAEETARLAVACGAASALRGAGRCREEDIRRLEGGVEFLRD
jgi:tagatose 6-phosphate kinase